jgi:hypothetical protein
MRLSRELGRFASPAIQLTGLPLGYGLIDVLLFFSVSQIHVSGSSHRTVEVFFCAVKKSAEYFGRPGE